MVHVQLFGVTTVTTELGILPARSLGGAKPRQILEILALSAGTPVPKDRLADTLWEGRPPRSWVGTLESYVCVLRQALGLSHGRSSGLNTVWHGYVLDPEVVSIDLTQFRSAVRAATATLDDPAACLHGLQAAIELVRGELLAGEPYASWAVAEREVVRREVASAAATAAAQAMALGRQALARQLAQVAVDHDPFAEEAWRILMESSRATGRRSEALRAYLELRTLLADELGTDPAPETQDLYADILGVGVPGRHRSAQLPFDEVHVLTQLLRQALARTRTVEVPLMRDPVLAAVGVRARQDLSA